MLAVFDAFQMSDDESPAAKRARTDDGDDMEEEEEMPPPVDLNETDTTSRNFSGDKSILLNRNIRYLECMDYALNAKRRISSQGMENLGICLIQDVQKSEKDLKAAQAALNLAVRRQTKKKGKEAETTTNGEEIEAEEEKDPEIAELEREVTEAKDLHDRRCKAILQYIHDYVNIVGKQWLLPVTNNRDVIIYYNTVESGQLRSYAGLLSALRPYVFDTYNLYMKTYFKTCWAFLPRVRNDVFNKYCGMKIEQDHHFDDLDYDFDVIQPALLHMVHLTGTNVEDPDFNQNFDEAWLREHEKTHAPYKAVMDFCCDIFQNPDQRPTHCVIFFGPQSAGKSNFIKRAICMPLGEDDPMSNDGVGSRGLAYVYSGKGGITGDFNSISSNRLATVIDEAKKDGELKSQAEYIKFWMQTNLTTRNEKFEKKEVVRECSRLFICTNTEEILVYEDPKQRRFLFLEMEKSDQARIKALFTHMETVEFQINWHKYMKARDLRGYDRTTPVLPQTRAMRRLATQARPPIVNYLIDRILQGPYTDFTYHCLSDDCRDIHMENKVCSKGRLPHGFRSHLDEPSTIPRIALQKDYETWLKYDERYKDIPKHERASLQWKSQVNFNKIYASGLLIGKINKSDIRPKFVTPLAHTVSATKKEGDITTTYTKVVTDKAVVERKTSLTVPSRKDMWNILKDMGWLDDSDVLPAYEEDDGIVYENAAQALGY